MKFGSIKELLKLNPHGQTVEAYGWVRTFRSNRFIALSDGSTIHTIQAVIDFEKLDESTLKSITTGAAIGVKGELVASQGSGQSVEIQVSEIEIHGKSPADTYPLQPKKHSLEFLREKAHLRMRTSTFGAVFRVRHALSFAIHNYFHER
ncbi:MAG TPA: OB-fold nucleic acid binding domain-containing protein, partial [Cryomorphaceae bacterium]|nr:OB-fold nucleic acid binding domain-containing protein [Cryomorphaceae bacterium]